MNKPNKNNTKTKISTARGTTDASKNAGEKKLLQNLHQIMKKAKAKKSAAEKDEKKAMKKLLKAEKKLTKANINKSKAEADVKRRIATRQAAAQSFDAAKIKYHARKDIPKTVNIQPVINKTNATAKPAIAPKKTAVKKTAPRKAVVKKAAVKKAAPKKAVPKKAAPKKVAPKTEDTMLAIAETKTSN